MKYLLDSNIIIYHLNNVQIATDFILKNFEDCSISLITYYEVLSFNPNSFRNEVVKELMDSFNIYEIDKNIILNALKNLTKKKIKIADNIIASTAQLYDLTLVTRNIQDFNNISIKSLNIFD